MEDYHESESSVTQSQIRNIVMQVKSGQKNKSVAFEELRELLRRSSKNIDNTNQSSSTPPPPPPPLPIPDASIGYDHFMLHSYLQLNSYLFLAMDSKFAALSSYPRENISHFSQDDRKFIISKLIEKKRQNRMKSSMDSPGLFGSPNAQNHSMESTTGIKLTAESPGTSSFQRYAASPASNKIPYRDGGDDTVVSSIVDSENHAPQNHHNWLSANSINLTGTESVHKHKMTSAKKMYFNTNRTSNPNSPRHLRRPSSAGAATRRSGPLELSKSHLSRSIDDSNLNSRSKRLTHAEIAIRQEMYRECTFHPRVSKLPDTYNSRKTDNVPFYDRVMSWKRERELDASRRKHLVVRNEDSDCTFHPSINRNSARAVAELRSGSNVNIVERLYNGSEAAQQQRAKFIEEELRKERELEAHECTFHPHLSTKPNRFANVRSKFDQKLKRPEDPEPPPPKECTFKPTVRIK